MKISAKIAQLKAINIDRLLDESLRANEEDILELNQDQLYKRGEIDVNVPSHRERYAPATIAQKKKRAAYPETDFVTLKWTGKFHESLKLLIFKDKIILSSTDSKWPMLEKVGKMRFSNALGLTKESIKKLRDIVLPGILKRIEI